MEILASVLIPTRCQCWSTAPCSPVGAGFLWRSLRLGPSATTRPFGSTVTAKEAKGLSSEERLVARSVDPKAEGLLSVDESSGSERGPEGRVSTNRDYPEILSELVEKNLHEIL